MREHDPLAALPGLVDGPVTPRAAFAEELRERLLSDLSADQANADAATGAMIDLGVVTPPVILADQVRSSRRRRLPVLLEIAAILILVVGLIAALMPTRTGNDQPPPTIDAVQGAAPVAMASPAAEGAVPSSQMRDDLLWQLPPRGDQPFFTDTILVDGTLYRSVQSAAFIGVEAIDAATGEQRWEQATPIGGQIAADDQGVYLIASNISSFVEGTGTPESAALSGPAVVTVVALDPATGAERWRANTGDLLAGPIVSDQILYVRDNTNYSLQAFDSTEAVHAIDTRDGSIIWSQVVGTPRRGIPLQPGIDSMVAGETTLAIVTSNNMLTVLDRDTGAIRWHLQDFMLQTTDLAVVNGRLVVSAFFPTPSRRPSELEGLTSPAGIISFGINDGSVRWMFNAGSFPADLAVAAGDLVAVLDTAPSNDKVAASPEAMPDYTVSGIDPASGSIIWIATGGFGEPPEIYPAADGGALMALVFRDRQSLQVVDAADGVLLLANTFTADMPLGQSPLVDSQNNVVYLSLSDGSLVAIRLNRYPQSQMEQLATPAPTSQPESGSGWMIPAEPDFLAPPDVVVDGGMIFRTIWTGMRNTSLQAASLETGVVLWTQRIEWPTYTSLADSYAPVFRGLAAADGLVFVEINTVVPFTGDSDDMQFTGDSMIAAFDQARGAPVWTVALGQQIGPLVYHDGSLIFGGADVVVSFDPATGEEQWRTSIGLDGQPILYPIT